MLSAVEILNRKTMLKDSIDQAVAEDRLEDARVLEGRIAELDDMLSDAVKAEDEAKQAAIAKGAVVQNLKPKNRVEMFFGNRSDFKPLDEGTTISVVTIDDPTFEDTSIPGWGESPFITFADTLASGTTDGDVKYMRRKTRGMNVQTWKSGQTAPKASSYFEWEKKTAPLEIIATSVPIEEPTLKRYGELQNLLENELTIGLKEEKDAHVFAGSDSEGITGIINTTGIQTYTAKSGDNVVDSIRRMVTLAIMNSRLYPTCVAVAPQVKETIDLLKDDNGAYLTLMSNGRVWNLPVIEDVNLVTVKKEGSGDTAVTKMHFGCMVYYAAAATVFTDGAQTLDIDRVNDQFLHNQLTMRLEEANALKVVYPDAFVWCVDAIPAQVVS